MTPFLSMPQPIFDYSNNSIWQVYRDLDSFFGPLNWWPAKSPEEVLIGAILTQNTSWHGVVLAISKLEEENMLSGEKIARASEEDLAPLIRSSGYYNQKAKRLINFFKLLAQDHGDLEGLGKLPQKNIRKWLLSVSGIGKETADSMLLYALNKEIFVIDSYTHRLAFRYPLGDEKTVSNYDLLQELFMKNIPKDLEIYNQYHALIVSLAKDYCRKKPLCSKCPLMEKCDKNLGELPPLKR